MKKTFVKKGFREIRKNWAQYLFLIIILGIGVSLYSTMYDLADSRKATLDAIYEESLFMDIQVSTLYGEMVNESTLQQVLARPGVGDRIEDIEVRLYYEVFIDHSSDGETKTSRGLVIGYEAFDADNSIRQSTVNRPLFFVDDPPEFSQTDARECYIERKFSKAHEIGGDGQITVTKGPQEFEFDILTQVNVPEYFFVVEEGSLFPNERSLGVMIIPIDTAHELLFGTEAVERLTNDYVIRLKNPDELEDFRETITEEFENVGIAVKTISKEENPAYHFLWTDYENDKESMNIFPFMIFSVAVLGLIVVLRRMIRVHRSQIGIFKAIGIPDKTILLYFSVIGVFIAIFGIITSLIVSLYINYQFNSLLNSLYDFAIMKSSISWLYYVYGAIISVILCVGCTLIPTWFALRIKPVEAIQNKEDITTTKVNKISSKVGRSRKMPVPLKLTLRNFLRRPGRSATSIFGVAIALGLFMGFAIIMDTVVVTLDQQVEDSKWDYEVTTDGFSLVNITESWTSSYPEIENVNPGIILPAKIIKDNDEEIGLIYALTEVKSAYRIELGKGGFSDGQMVISEYLSENLDVDKGDELTMELPYLDMETGYSMVDVEVEISGIHSNHMGLYIFMDLSTMQQLTNLHGMINIIYLNTEDGASNQDLENTIVTTPGISSVTYIEDQENILEQYFDLFLGATFLFLVLSIVLAGAIAYNLFMINAHESRRDYATMKTLGTSLKKLSYLIFIEAGFIMIFGILLGILVGYGMAAGMFANIEGFDVYNFNLVFSWVWFAIGSTMIIVVLLLVSWRTIRYIDRINIADVIRERST
ncbi:MAG: FtsX-like permease family protein [Thermoplasmata archaeon]|nr:MAG: FtsX-like permease family protein [Thermoplasmata archaeon]